MSEEGFDFNAAFAAAKTFQRDTNTIAGRKRAEGRYETMSEKVRRDGSERTEKISTRIRPIVRRYLEKLAYRERVYMADILEAAIEQYGGFIGAEPMEKKDANRDGKRIIR